MSNRPERPSAPPSAPSPAPRKLDLSRIRHDLRTPINHILGYCEMLLEEEQVPAAFTADLHKIHAGGRQLVALINEYFDDETFETKARDLHQLCHELRTPVNHIIGYADLLQEQIEGGARKKVLPDLKRIHTAATTWLALMEEYLIAPESDRPAAGPPASALTQGMGFQAPGEQSQAPLDGALLVVDDDEANRDMLARRLRRHGATVTLAANGLEALKLMRAQAFDVVLLDLIMPGFDGYQVLAKMKADPALRDVAVIMISALDQEEGVARCIEMGAEDYLSKPFNPVFLRARIGACLEKKRLRERERATLRDLQRTQERLAGELDEAAQYVRSLLPPPMEQGGLAADWRFVPSAELGGDVLNYFWLDDDRFAFFIVDVCGHGVAAAIFSMTVCNTLRPQASPAIDFGQPGVVLTRLNEQFPMEQQNQMYFTIWYGVYDRRERKLSYASAGHPPAVLLAPSEAGAPHVHQLRTPGVIIGYGPESAYQAQQCDVPAGSALFVFSDGAYEIARPDGRTLQLSDLLAELLERGRERSALDDITAWARAAHGSERLDDDLSIVRIKF